MTSAAPTSPAAQPTIPAALPPPTAPVIAPGAASPWPYNLGAALASFVRRGGRVESVIDIGASDGRWSRQVARHLPHARFHMIEALESHRHGLELLARENPRVSFALAAAGRTVGRGFLLRTADPLGGGVFESGGRDDLIEVPMTTIDHEIARLDLRPPYFLKLDTHGFELEILEGARAATAGASLIQLEVYNFDLRAGGAAPRFPDMCRRMELMGFRCSAAFDLMNRPGDGALWQLDMFFEPAESAIFRVNAYETP